MLFDPTGEYWYCKVCNIKEPHVHEYHPKGYLAHWEDHGYNMLEKLGDTMDPQTKVIAQVIQERRMQDRRWGGAAHDDQHSNFDWFRFIDHQWGRMNNENRRECLIKIAALAVAAVESLDRKNENGQSSTDDVPQNPVV